MDRKSLQTNLQKVLAQRNIFLFFAAVLSIAVVVLSCLLIIKKERIVIIPTVGPSMWIEEEKTSDSYLDKFGSYLADLLLTRTPSDVDKKNHLLLEHVHPSFYHEAKKQLDQEKENISRFSQSLLFRPARSFIDPVKQTYTIEGELLIFVGKKGEQPSCAQIEQKKFVFGFQCQRGKLFLKSLKREDI